MSRGLTLTINLGAGAGGSSAAYHLSKFATTAGFHVNLTVFERNSYIGGRSTTVNAYNDSTLPVELGASIFVSANQILADAVKEFDLPTLGFLEDEPKIAGAQLAVWNGQSIVFSQEGGNSLWDNAKLLWKYGLAPIRTMRLMKSTVASFLSLYNEPIFPWRDLTEAVQNVGLLDVTAVTGEQYMAANGITGAFGHDVVQASTRVNYAQNLKYIHGLEAMVCMATDGAMSVDGGNWQIFDKMIRASNATTLLETEVTELIKQDDDSYVVSFSAVDRDEDSVDSQSFDAVIVAAPYQFSDISLSPSAQHMPDEIPYVELHVTLFTSPHLLSPVFFGMAADKPAPKVILTTLPDNEEPRRGNGGCGSPGFFSISLLRPIVNPQSGHQEYLYKIFSPAPPTTTFLTHLLGLKQPHEDSISEEDITWMYRKVWNSYPYEYPRVTFDAIQLDENLWYTSSIESFISTMETSALSGMNVARLIVDQLSKEMSGERSLGSMSRPSILPETSAV